MIRMEMVGMLHFLKAFQAMKWEQIRSMCSE